MGALIVAIYIPTKYLPASSQGRFFFISYRQEAKLELVI
jgi:hypothetical protein